ncbi:MAG: ABC transporter permease [Nitrospirota bacterium]
MVSSFIKDQIRFFTVISKNKNILFALVQKELKNRYASSALGFLWAVLQPLAAIFIYTIVFSLVFRTSVPDSYKHIPYVIFLMCGLIPYQVFSETVGRSCNILLENINMITKMVFPYELFPVSILIISFIIGGITWILTIIFMLIIGVEPVFSNFIYLPLFFIPLILVTIGLSWIVSCLSVVYRDIVHVVPVALNLLFFATPVLYSYEMIEKIKPEHSILIMLAKLNPLLAIVEGHRISLIGKTFILDYDTILISYIFSFGIFLIGGIIFHIFKRELADLF